ncbi:MAG: hypothetical protein GYB65_02635 [Chloroflexi bacterium]|nr:hypothetical protein [Chloroflexota bacterium]
MSDSGKPKRGKPRVQRGQRTKIALTGMFKGVEMRSKLEVHFAHELEAREIAWRYEPERIGAGGYLVDFYLPELRTWVEVKGRFEPRDSLLLPNVAVNLKRDRGERLFLFMKTKAFQIGSKQYTELTLDEFWQMVQNPPE